MESQHSKSISILFMIVSYLSFLLLIMQPTAKGIILTLGLFALGLIWILFRKIQYPLREVTPSSLLSASFFAFSIGSHFYNQWCTSSKVQLIASILRLPTQLLTAVTATCLSLCAILCISCAAQKAMQYMRKLAHKNSLISAILFCFIIASVTVILSQTMALSTAFSMGYSKFLKAVLLVSAAIMLLYSLTGAFPFSVTIGSGLFIMMAAINAYVYRFRARLFEPVDIFSFGTAMNVADNYQLFPIPHAILFSCGIWVGLLICVYGVYAKVNRNHSGKQQILLAICCFAGALFVFQYASSLHTYHWNKEGANNHGYILDFVSKIKEASVAKPDGYDPEIIEETAQRYFQDFPAEDDTNTPHIIVIMNEAFSDLRVFGELKTNIPVTPFIDSLTKDTISGYTLTSVYGGNTSNSEYEFLTGNSMSQLSPNSVPYQQYLTRPAYSMVSYLKRNYGYNCIAMHPYLSSSWNRPNTYANFGFDESMFMEDFPQQKLVREYISDQEMFEKIVSIYENRGADPLFLFGVSMQNHGSYTYEGDNFTNSVSLTGLDQSFPEVEQYLSLIHETDAAVEYLISYFSKADEDVLIVFFGDHQPSISNTFFAKAMGFTFDSLDANQRKYTVPFFIWANYDIDEQHGECTGLNYLANYVYEAAGLPLPPYNRFLSDMEAVIPSINANGFYSLRDQKYISFDSTSEEEKKWLELYEQLQYNSLFDKKNRSDILFPVLE